MENQHEYIMGDRVLTQEEIDIINDGKMLAERIGDFVARLRGNRQFDQRWVSIGATHCQEGFMALTRAVARPTTF